MSSSFLLSLLLLALLTGTLAYFIQAEGGFNEVPRLLERVNITLPARPTPTPAQKLPANFTSGDSRFSQGSCATDANCMVSGCSSEVCGAREAITTCEFSDSFPNTQTYSCGCVKGKCGWRTK